MKFILPAGNGSRCLPAFIRLMRPGKKAAYILLLIQFLCVSAYSQTRVSGTVKDSKGEPISGASIKLKETSSGTTSDGDGKYLITVPEKAVLVFSNVGYLSQEIKVGSRTNIDVVL